ncbi:MAG: hypothetical protein QY328_15245 [Anaerolineales bacterium]|nr:MAG: hypothetical protein QY328_15245 [Anaerolineales bacterium]
MTEDTFDDWETFLNPQKLKQNLIRTSLFISTYETIKSRIVDEIRGFYTFEWKLNEQTREMEPKIGDQYKKQVLDLYSKDEFHACCLWLVEGNAFTQEDLITIAKARKHRNAITHEMSKFLISPKTHSVDDQLFAAMIEIIKKFDRWWFKEIEASINPEIYKGNIEETDWDNVIRLGTMSLQLMASLFDGDDTYLAEIHKLFVDEAKKNNKNPRP